MRLRAGSVIYFEKKNEISRYSHVLHHFKFLFQIRIIRCVEYTS